MTTFTLHNGDCLAVLKSIPDNFFDSVVTDPPYHLSNKKEGSKGFMGQAWDGGSIAFRVETWTEVMRVLKPGGHLLAFSGSRTYHRMAVAIEDAGFEIRDQIMWLYGSGFPKSMDISKQFDKAAGAEREVIRERNQRFGLTQATGWNETTTPRNSTIQDTAPATKFAKQWDGWGTALKPAHEPIVMARKPLIGTVVANIEQFGTGGINIDGCRVPAIGRPHRVIDPKVTNNNVYAGRVAGDETFMGGSKAEGTTDEGRWPANVIHDGSDEVEDEFAKYGVSKSGVAVQRNRDGEVHNRILGARKTLKADDVGFGDSGTVSRFFYCAKASKKDREEGLEDLEIKSAGTVTGGRKEGSAGLNSPRAGAGRTEGGRNVHPTVKPTALMRYLIRLVTPPGGTTLDMFMGSGSTGKAAMLEGVNFVGIEMMPEYFDIAERRIRHAQTQAAPQEEEPAADTITSIWGDDEADVA